jgi:hypothetical protein
MEVSKREVAMAALVTFVLAAGLFLLLELLWCRPSRFDPSTSPWAEGEPLAGGPQLAFDVESDPLALPFVRHRLDVLAAELERLDHDETVFARAFRYRAAQSAYDALLVEAIRLAALSRLTTAARAIGDPGFELEFGPSLAPLREELEL